MKLLTLNLILTALLVVSTLSSRTIAVEGILKPTEGVLMTTTNYSELDSCHYRVKEGCLTASGTIASETTIACPRSWKFGTKVLIEGKEYVCEDHYQKNLSDRIDIFQGYGIEAHKKSLEFGIKNLTIVIK